MQVLNSKSTFLSLPQTSGVSDCSTYFNEVLDSCSRAFEMFSRSFPTTRISMVSLADLKYLSRCRNPIYPLVDSLQTALIPWSPQFKNGKWSSTHISSLLEGLRPLALLCWKDFGVHVWVQQERVAWLTCVCLKHRSGGWGHHCHVLLSLLWPLPSVSLL